MSTRLTFVTTGGKLFVQGIDTSKCNSAVLAALERLRAYEDTGLSPDEIRQLLAAGQGTERAAK